MRMHLTSIFVAAAACVGCAAEPETDTTGTIAVALTASDPGGATYRLTEGARLLMSSGTYYDEFALDGDATFVRISVPPGDYGAELLHDNGYTTQWPLTRTFAGVTETVQGALTTPMPAPVTIADTGQTNLVLHFNVPDIGVVTFAEGDLDVTLDVDETVATSVHVHFGSSLDVASVTQDPAAPPVIATLPQVGNVDLQLTINAQVSGPWTKSSQTSACAPVTVLGSTGGTPALHDLLAESWGMGAFSQLCVFGGAGVAPQAQLLTYQVTPTPVTATFTGLGDFNWLFMSYLTVDLPSPIFDGTNLDLQPLVGAHTHTGSGFTRVAVRAPGTAVRTTWHRAFYTGDISIALTPQ
jgi:hypothetical protein